MRCDRCNAAYGKETTRLPRAWKRHAGEVWCDTCWRRAYVLRAVTIPVAAPLDGDWPALRALLTTAWSESTTLANWAVQTLAAGDVVRRPGDERMPPMARVNLYGEFQSYEGRATWQGAATSASCLLRHVEAKYRKERLACIWRRERALPSYRYPVPWPVHNARWSARKEGERWVVRVELPGGSTDLVLRGGPDWRRALRVVEQIAAGTLATGEAAIYRQGIGGRSGAVVTEREPGGKGAQHSRVMLKVTAWLPRGTASEEARVLRVRPDADAFLVAHIEGDGRLWWVHADHVRRWVAAHRVRLLRAGHDGKWEVRMHPTARAGLNAAREVWCRKHARRMETWAHQVSAMVSEYARRQRVTEVRVSVVDRGYVEQFPWDSLRTKLAYKLDALGIACVEVDAKEDAAWETEQGWIESRQAVERTGRWLQRGALPLQRPAFARVGT